MKKVLLAFLILFVPFSLVALGYNINFAFLPGITECLGGDEVGSNKNIWEADSQYGKYLSLGGRLSTDIVFSKKFSIETGIEYKNVNLNYSTNSDSLYSNGLVNLNYSVFQLPILFKYSIPIKEQASVISSVNISFGPVFSVISPFQVYKDELTTYSGNFISPLYNAGLEADLSYSHALGTGKILIGIKCDYNFIKQGYKISGNDISFGNTLTVSPLIGYAFVLFEDKSQTHRKEKNRRIKDYIVK